MPTQSFLETYAVVTDLAVVAVVLLGLASGLSRTTAPSAERIRTWIGITVSVLAWYGLSTYLAVHDVYRASRAVEVPALPFAVFIPIIAGLWLLSRLRIITRVLDATPLSWLVGVQVYRVVGVIFLILLGAGQLPRAFALPAGTGDVIVGLLALPVAWLSRTGSRRALIVAYVWNGLGILDFIVAIATGFLSSPGRIQLLALDHPNLIASAYPLVMIPVFLVPLSCILHGLCLWKIRRQSRVGVTNALVDCSASSPLDLQGDCGGSAMKDAEHPNAKMPDESAMRAAFADRDPRFDGSFVYGVSTTGYRWGLDRKRVLIDHERARRTS